jgi:hypothetical protein
MGGRKSRRTRRGGTTGVAEAVAAGVWRDVAEAGRTLVRVSHEDEGSDDRWDSDVAEMSGINDDGLAMNRFWLLRPRTAPGAWRRIAETTGIRGVRMPGASCPASGAPISSICQRY